MMKYFTWHWWRGAGEPSPHAADDYIHYFNFIRDQLPSSMVELHVKHTLHDSRLISSKADFAKGQFTMSLNGYTRDDLDCNYTLAFSGVSQVITSGDPAQWPEGGPSGGNDAFGDLGYYEVEVVKPGCFEMRMIFSSGIEMAITWQNFSFECLVSS